MARLQFLGIFIILVVCWSGQYVDGQGVRFSLRGTTYQNNSLVTLEEVGQMDDALLCLTNNTACCARAQSPGQGILGDWYYSNGTGVPNSLEGWDFYRNRGPSVVRMNRRRGRANGIYRCEIPDAAGVNQTIYIGVYTVTTGVPSVTGLTFSGQSRTLTCTSTGGPATNVTWRRDGVLITLNGTYQQTKIVINTTTSTYQTVLTIDPSVSQSDILGTYNCTVENDRGRSSMTRVVTVLVSVTAGGNPTLGQPYTLTCNVSVASGVTGTPTVQWVGPGSSAPIVTGGDFTVSSTSPYTLTVNPLRQSHAGQYTCHASVGGDNGTASVVVNITVPPPTVSVGFSPPGAVPYAGRNFTLSCVITLNGGITESDVMVTNRWTKDGTVLSGIPGRVTFPTEQRATSSVFIRTVVFSPLSSSMDNGTYACVVTLTPVRPEFVNAVNRSGSISLAVRVPAIIMALTPNTTRLPNVAPYNTFSLTCTGTSSIEGVGNVALPKGFIWRRRYGSSRFNLVQLTSNATIQIQDGDNLNQPTSSSVLTVTEDIPRDYWYRCRVDLNLTADMIFNRTDIRTITVTGPSSPQPSNLMSTGVTHNRATIQWTVSRIAYTPENYTVHFGTSPGSLTPFNQQQQSGDNFTATNLQFSVQLTGLSAGTTYYYQVVAVNSVGSTASVELSFMTTTLPPDPPEMFHITLMTTTSLRFSWQAPAVLNGVLTGYQLSCHPSLQGIPSPQNLTPGPTMNTAVLPNLSPGVRYNCSIMASNSAGRSDPVYAVGTTTETAPAGRPQSFTIAQRSSRNMTFSWSPPPPTQRNGVITAYFLSCVPEAGGGNSISMQYRAAGTFTLGGFTPATSYNCFISAMNSEGSGPVSNMISTTLEAPPGHVNNCPSRWTDLASTIQVTWTAPERPNGMLLRYHLQLTTYGGRRVIASERVGSGTLLTQLDNSELQDGVPYIVSIFAENSAGNGTKCNVTDFTNELPPPAPSNVMVARVSDTTIRVSWQPLSLVEARGHIMYRVMVTPTTGSKRRRQATQGERMCSMLSPCEVPANDSSVIVGGLDRDTSYSVTVMAVNSEDEDGPTSVPITAAIPTVPAQTCINIGTVVGVVVALVVVIIIMGVVIIITGVVIGVLVARNRHYKLSVQQHAVKDEPVKWSEVAGSGDTTVIATQYEAYATVNELGHEYEVPEHTAQQQPGSEDEISVTKCPAYVPTSEQEGGRVEEAVYEAV